MLRKNPFLNNDYSFSQGCSFQKEDPQMEIEKLKEAINAIHLQATQAIGRATDALIRLNEPQGEMMRLTNLVNRLTDILVKKEKEGKL